MLYLFLVSRIIPSSETNKLSDFYLGGGYLVLGLELLPYDPPNERGGSYPIGGLGPP